MKKILLSLFAFVLAATMKINAQCSIKDVFITIPATIPVSFPNAGNPNPTQNGSNCDAYFDVTFKFDNNGGNKVVVIQAWKGDSQLRPLTDPLYDGDYPNYWNCTNGTSTENKPPKLADLRRTALPYSPGSPGPLPFLNIGFNIENFTDGNPATLPILTVYSPDGTNVSFSQTNYTIAAISAEDVDGFRTITLQNLFVSIPNYTCGTGANFNVDVFSSQAASANWPIHCVICNQLFAFNYPLVTAFVDCNFQNTGNRAYRVRIQNPNTSQPVAVTWKAYLDVAPLNNLGGPGPEDLLELIDNHTTVEVIPAQTTIMFGAYPYIVSPVSKKFLNVWVVVDPVGLVNDVSHLGANICSSLPVNFKSFTATRNRSNVLVKWETASEQNNSGFAVERNINGSWEQVAFIPSQAANGNSNDALSYQFIDLNNTKGISQYRLKQVDFDSKSKYSEIRSVRGDGQKGRTIVYPNPSTDGKVNVVFEDGNVSRDISVMDMAGRTVKQIKGVTNNNITIDNLTPGMYTLRVFVPATGDQTVEKIVVNKR